MTTGNPDSKQLEQAPPFRPLKLVIIVLLLLLAISSAAQWYSRNITMPRYCKDPVGAMGRVHQVLTENTPAGTGDRKPYIIAARLTFLLPRESDEPLKDYMSRLQRYIDQQCQ
ncbi:MAG: hypothetical protein GY814_09690 [Gammaproteobacteria bacterium]|nr:hypothetical protein [Gammaproteobacteria bacterium]